MFKTMPTFTCIQIPSKNHKLNISRERILICNVCPPRYNLMSRHIKNAFIKIPHKYVNQSVPISFPFTQLHDMTNEYEYRTFSYTFSQETKPNQKPYGNGFYENRPFPWKIWFCCKIFINCFCLFAYINEAEAVQLCCFFYIMTVNL